jgi:CBS domain-containing protein
MNPAKVPHHLQRHSCGRYRPFPVVENGRIVGAITRFDLLRAVRGYLRRAGARLLTLTGTSRVSEALELFEPRPNLQEDFPVLADDFRLLENDQLNQALKFRLRQGFRSAQ